MFKEEEIINGCKKSDSVSQRKLYEHFEKKMLAVCMRYTKNRMEAEDILQEAFVKVFTNIKDFRNDCPLEQWIKKININTALKFLRKQILVLPASDSIMLENYGEEENLAISNYNFLELINMIQQLPSGYQVVFNLYAIEGYNHREISEMLGISEGTSKSQYARAKATLQQIILQKSSYEFNLSAKTDNLK